MNLTLEQFVALLQKEAKRRGEDVLLLVEPAGTMQLMVLEVWGDAETKELTASHKQLEDLKNEAFDINPQWRDKSGL